MTRRDLVKHAIQHRETERCPYLLDLCGETIDQVKSHVGCADGAAWLDNDVWGHSCGDVQELIPRLIEMKLDVLNPVQPECMDIAKLKRDYGDRLTFWGGISTQRTLPFGTPDEVRAEARQVRDLMSAGGGYIFAPAQGIQGDVPPANIVALLDVARERRMAHG